MADDNRRSTEKAYLNGANATQLWALVRSETAFNRWVVDDLDPEYNQRLLYLLAVAVFRRVEPLAKQRAWRKLLRVTEAYAEGKASDDQLTDAHEEADRIPVHKLSAPQTAAVWSVSLLPDDYKVLEGVDHVTDAAGYLAAIEAGTLARTASIGEARSVWKTPAFVEGKKQQERALCDLIRDIFGNPFRPPPALDPAWPAWNRGTIPRMAKNIYDKKRFDGLPVLADALEEAGCSHQELLNHCRGPGPHVRGCWALDLLLGKSCQP